MSTEDSRLRPPPPPKRRAQPVADEFSDYERGGAATGGVDGGYGRTQGGGILDDIPETTIGPAVSMNGELSFERLLRIDGSFEGTLTSKGDLIVGSEGVLVGNVAGMNELIVDGGRVVGDVQVEKVWLKGAAQVHGNITAKSVTMEGGTTVVGALNINPFAPEKVNNKGELLVIEEESKAQAEKGDAEPAGAPATAAEGKEDL
jgi:cytoskeletal protein CcmA (bactofilin family)